MWNNEKKSCKGNVVVASWHRMWWFIGKKKVNSAHGVFNKGWESNLSTIKIKIYFSHQTKFNIKEDNASSKMYYDVLYL